METNVTFYGGEKELKDLYTQYDAFAAKHKEVVEKRSLGKSPEERDVPAFIITDPSVPFEQKQVTILTLGRHGNEIGTRSAGMAIVHYLLEKSSSEIRKNQLVVVVPVANPDGFVRNEFHSSMFELTATEKEIFGRLYSAFPPDLVVDYHSFGFSTGSRHDRSDMEVIIPANTTRWAMDEQIHQALALKMKESAEKSGWPYEIHTLEDLADYYFGGDGPSEQPWKALKEKMFFLQMQNDLDCLLPVGQSSYTNYSCVPAYLGWHSLVFGIELNHWAIQDNKALGESAVAPLSAILNIGCERVSWEPFTGFPVNIIVGDFRNSIRSRGENAAERRKNRVALWKERKFFSMPQRVSSDRNRTIARVRYFGEKIPLSFELCLRMRKVPIHVALLENKPIQYESFDDTCSSYMRFPIEIQKPGVTEVVIEHDAL